MGRGQWLSARRRFGSGGHTCWTEDRGRQASGAAVRAGSTVDASGRAVARLELPELALGALGALAEGRDTARGARLRRDGSCGAARADRTREALRHRVDVRRIGVAAAWAGPRRGRTLLAVAPLLASEAAGGAQLVLERPRRAAGAFRGSRRRGHAARPAQHRRRRATRTRRARWTALALLRGAQVGGTGEGARGARSGRDAACGAVAAGRAAAHGTRYVYVRHCLPFGWGRAAL